MDHIDVRYLEAKRTVDDRALNRRVRNALLDRLPPEPSIVEFAPGTGTTVPRLVAWGVRGGRYRGIEREREFVEQARERRASDLESAGHVIERTTGGFRVGRNGGFDVRFETGDALDAAEDSADLVIAQAFADLVPLGDLLDALDRVTGPDGLAYLPITFDGGTLFQPDHPVDDRVERAYHATIAARPGRDPRAGRHLLTRLQEGGAENVVVGASDWIVRPAGDGYPADERYFLERILGYVADALDGAPVPGADDWLSTRRAQLGAAELTYVAHQYDLLCRM
jgi:hypothetical protein